MNLIISSIIVTISILCLLFKRSSIPYLFIVCRILIPENVTFFNTELSINSFVILVFILSIFIGRKFKIDKDDKTLILMITIFFIYSIFSLFFSEYISLSKQLGYLVEFIFTQCIPAILIAITINKTNSINKFNNVLLVCSIITCVYGILTFLLRRNIYVELITGNSITESSWKGYSSSATFSTTTTFGYFLTIVIPYVIYILYNETDNKNIKLAKIALPLLIIGIFICRKRSTFVTIAFFMVALLLSTRKTKRSLDRTIFIIAIIITALIIVRNVPGLQQLYNYIKASVLFFDDNAVHVNNGELGSTMSLRINQLIYPFTEIKDNIIFGHGFGWSAVYLDLYELHPILFGFESIFALGICDLGIMFFIVWPAVFINLYVNYLKTPKQSKNKTSLLFVLTYVINLIASGLNYFYLFLILLVIIKKTMKCNIINNSFEDNKFLKDIVQLD